MENLLSFPDFKPSTWWNCPYLCAYLSLAECRLKKEKQCLWVREIKDFFATSLTKEISAENCNRFWTLPICIESRYHRFHWLANETNTFSTVAALRIMFLCFLGSCRNDWIGFDSIIWHQKTEVGQIDLSPSWKNHEKIIQLIPFHKLTSGPFHIAPHGPKQHMAHMAVKSLRP